MSVVESPVVTVTTPVPGGWWRMLRDLVGTPTGAFGLVGSLLVVVVVLFAPVLAPHDPNAQDVANRFAAPTAAHLSGTDALGRDLASRVIYGTRAAVLVAVPAVALGLVIGLLAGLAAGYLGRKVDISFIGLSDAALSFPPVVLALAVIGLFGPSRTIMVTVIGIAFAPYYFRVCRSLVLSARGELYVEAERSLWASAVRVVGLHILPWIIPPLLIIAAMDIPSAIIFASGLSFIGIGTQPPDADLGVLLNEGYQHIFDSAWVLLAPAIALAFVTLSFTFLSETVRDVTNPRAGAYRPRGRWRR